MTRNGVIVLGMHRSGTSAVARMVNLLGVSMGRRRDTSGWSAANPRGYWESLSLLAYNDALLERFHATWHRPPTPIIDPRSLLDDGERLRARRAFAHVYRKARVWVWKDPRNCLLLEYWLDALDVRPVVLYVYRHPAEVAQSLHHRDGLPIDYSVGLWERYNQRGAAAATGLPALVVSYADLVRSPVEQVAACAAFLDALGVIATRPTDIERAAHHIEPGLKHWTTETRHKALPDTCAALLATLDDARGEHPALHLSMPHERPELQRMFDAG